MHKRIHRATTQKYRDGMLEVADRLCHEFPHLSWLTVAQTMNEVRRQPGGGLDDPDPDTLYRLTRSCLVDAVRPWPT